MNATEEPLPPGWDARYNRHYFVDTKTGVPQWVDPRKNANASHRSSTASSVTSSTGSTPVMHNQSIPARSGSPVGHTDTSVISNGASKNMNVNMSHICAQTENLSITDSRSSQVSTTSYQSYNALVTTEKLNQQATPGFAMPQQTTMPTQTTNQPTTMPQQMTNPSLTMPQQASPQQMTNPSLTMPQQTTTPQQMTNPSLTMPQAHTGHASNTSSPDSAHAAMGWRTPHHAASIPGISSSESVRPPMNRHSTSPADINAGHNTQPPPPVPSTNATPAQPVAAYPVTPKTAAPGGIVSPNVPVAPATGQTQYVLRTDANGKKYYVPVQLQTAVNKNPQVVPAGQPVLMNGKIVYLNQQVQQQVRPGQPVQVRQVQQVQQYQTQQQMYNQQQMTNFQQKFLSVGKEVGKVAAKLAIASNVLHTVLQASHHNSQQNSQQDSQQNSQQDSSQQSDNSGGFNFGDMMGNVGDFTDNFNIGDITDNFNIGDIDIGSMFSGDN
ncbi:8927_t:CDS:2 [Paraglomus occultum]|uniref:8927_t:CDS:1 n=1 Tax=Paraglomus occultum TaxID=144539 RepID=A0A9N9BUF8_9GLOM|nr:8927_t:CDS:2 [Paraglomus occultum]